MTEVREQIETKVAPQEEKVREIPLRVSVELGHFKLDISKSNPLAAGKVLSVNSDAPGLVKLVYQGTEIGRGELLSVDDKLAIRIVKNWSK